MMLEQELEWEPVNEKFINNDQANRMLARSMREPYASIFKKYAI